MYRSIRTLPAGLWIAITAFGLTALTPAHAEEAKKPTVKAARPLMEMVFVLDTTGSMGGLIEGAKQKIWDIVNGTMKTPADRRPEVRIGLVAYRDHGDDYVTKVLPLTSDLDKVYSTLMDYQAGGGGDGPEDVRQALADGLEKAGWSDKKTAGRSVVQTLFLVGDAPPHDDYVQEPDVITTTAKAVGRGIFVNTIQCGGQPDTAAVWQKIARRGEGQFFAIAQDGGVQVASTPYDEKLAKLGAKIGRTYTAFGGGAGAKGDSYRATVASRALAMEEKVTLAATSGDAGASGAGEGTGRFYGGVGGVGGGMALSAPKAATPAPVYAAAASRAVNKALNSFAYDGSDLLTALENGKVTLDKVKPEDLPADLKKLSPAARKAEIEKRLAERKAIRSEILALSKKRDAYARAEREKAAKKSKGKGFDSAVSDALVEQAKKRGIKL